MQAVHDDIETIHLYVVRENERRPFIMLPLVAALLCLVAVVGVTIYSAVHPSYEHATLRVPAQFLPLQTFRAAERIIPTGVRFYPATTAHGILTFTNGSVITEQLPAGMIFSGQGREVMTDTAVTVPAGSASGYGVARVSAHAVTSGQVGNIAAYTINQVYGTSLFVRSLTAFTGGNDAYSVTVQLPKDRQTALTAARARLAVQRDRVPAILAHPCSEDQVGDANAVTVTWGCQFARYRVPSYMRVTAARLVGKNFLVDVLFIPRPARLWVC